MPPLWLLLLLHLCSGSVLVLEPDRLDLVWQVGKSSRKKWRLIRIIPFYLKVDRDEEQVELQLEASGLGERWVPLAGEGSFLCNTASEMQIKSCELRM